MSRTPHATLTCHVCGKAFPERAVRPFSLVRPGVSRLIEAGHPGWAEGKVICIPDLATARRAYVEELLEEERGELGVLEHQVLDAMSRDVMISQNPEEDAEERMTRGERIADRVAEVGGSWAFIIGFMVCLVVWMGINVLHVFQEPFDPYPFILLNLHVQFSL